MGRVIHFEIHADDPARAIVFYETVFGWKFHKWEGEGAQDYWLITTGEDDERGINGGLLKRQGRSPAYDNPVSSFVCTIEVDKVAATEKEITENGGNIVVDKAAISGVGWLAYAKDTEGNIIGVMENDKNAKT
jgi:predicted enzyme related to lactoylglutathione lyase